MEALAGRLVHITVIYVRSTPDGIRGKMHICPCSRGFCTLFLTHRQRKFDWNPAASGNVDVRTPAAEIQTLIDIVARLRADCSIGTAFLAADLSVEAFPFLSISYAPQIGFHFEALRGDENTALLTGEQVRYWLASASEQAPDGGAQACYAVHPDGTLWPVVAVEPSHDEEFAMFLSIPANTGDPAPLLFAYAKNHQG